MKLLLFAVFLVVSLYTIQCTTDCPSDDEGMFIVEPQPQTVALGSQAVFNCTVVGHMGSPLFTMNGQYVSKETAEGRNGSLTNVNWTNCNKTIIFRLPGLAEYNNTEIVCIILSNSGNTVPSDTVLLRVQGPPEHVSDLSIHHQYENTHAITWTAPFSLEGVQTLYNFSVIDRNNGTWPGIDTTVTGTSYTTTLVPCHAYTFTVTPFNDAGSGSHSELEYFFPGAPVSPAIHNISISDLILNPGNGLVIATIQYPVTSTCYINQNITIEAHTVSDGPFTSASQVVDDSVTVVFDDIPLNKVLYVNLVLSNQFGSSPVLGDIIIKTYNIQSVSLTKNNRNGTSCFKCEFLSNSQTSGCLLHLVPVTSTKCSLTRYVTIMKDDNCSSTNDVCINGLYSGRYNIEVYDLYNHSTGPSNTEPSNPQVVSDIDIAGLQCPDNTIPPVRSESSSNRLLSMATSTVRQTPIVTGEAVEEGDHFDTMRTAGILIGGVCGILIIVVVVILAVYIYRRRQIKQGALRINESSDNKPDNIVVTTTIQNDEAASIPPSFSSLSGPPPYQPPPAVNDNYDQYPTEQYIIMHSASPRSPTASNSHLALIQGSCASSSSSSVHKDFNTSGHYDHLIQTTDDQESSKKYSFDSLSQPKSLKSNNDPYSFELRPFHRNEHLV